MVGILYLLCQLPVEIDGDHKPFVKGMLGILSYTSVKEPGFLPWLGGKGEAMRD